MPKKAKADEADVLDTMIASLADLLEEKGLITQEEWDQKIQKESQVLALLQYLLQYTNHDYYNYSEDDN